MNNFSISQICKPYIKSIFTMNIQRKSIFCLTILFFTLFCLSSSAIVVNKLDNVSPGNLAYSGLLPTSDTSSDQLFFTFYSAKDAKQQADIANYPLLVVVGSPGSSSQYMNLAGLGPLTLKNDMTTAQNPNTATNFANLLFVDLLGNGFSFVANVSNFPTKSEDYGQQLTYALNALAKESVLGQSKKIVLVGEGTFLRSLPGLGDIQGLSGIIHFSAWPELYAVSRYYGVAGIQLKIFTNSERVAIESTLVTCYNNVIAKKYVQAHNCYDSILNFVELKSKNVNVFNVHLGPNVTEHLPMIQYYFSQPSTVSLFKAPTSKLFESQSSWTWSKTYSDFAVNKTTALSQFMRDFLNVKQWFISGDNDYIAYKQSLRFWLENELTFVESATFKPLKLEDVVFNGQTVGYTKGVKQVRYTELINSGHYVANDTPDIFASMLKDWLSTLGEQQKEHITKQAFDLALE